MFMGRGLQELRKEKTARTTPSFWRKLMKSKMTKLSTAAIVIIAVLIGINQLGGSSVAWGNVINNVGCSAANVP